MDQGIPVDPDDYDPPPHDGYWPTTFFLINRAYVDSLTTSWRTVPNSDGIRARKSVAGLHLRDPTGVIYTFTITATEVVLDDTNIPIYIAERI